MVIRATAAIAAVREQRREIRATFRASVLSERARAERRIAVMEQELIKTEERISRRTLRAPVDGTVQQLAVHTVGGVVTPAQPLMVVVPEDDVLEIEAAVRNKDIGFVAAGQPADVKLETFTFTRYGSIPGRVVAVSADAVADERQGLVYTARVALLRASLEVDGRMVSLAPGMAATVEVKTGRRRIIDFLLDPILRRGRESLRER